MSGRFSRTRVSFLLKKRLIRSNNRITSVHPEQKHFLVDNSTKSVHSTPATDSTILTSNGIHSITKNSLQENYLSNTDRAQRFTPNQNKLNRLMNTSNQQKKLQNNRQLSGKHKFILFLSVLYTLLRIITFVLPYVLIYLILQKVTVLTQLTETYVSEVSSQKYHCSGISPWSNWGRLTGYNNTIMMTIDTSSCQFNTTSLYFTSMTGIGNHYALAGYTAIYGPTNTSFVIIVSSLFSWDATLMLSLSINGQLVWYCLLKLFFN